MKKSETELIESSLVRVFRLIHLYNEHKYKTSNKTSSLANDIAGLDV